MNVKYYNDFMATNNTNDYDSDFHFTLSVGVDEDTGNKVYVDTSGYVCDKENEDYAVHTYFDDEIKGRMYDGDTEIPVPIPDDISQKAEEITRKAVQVTESDKLSAYAEYTIPKEFPKNDISFDEENHTYTFANIGTTLGREIYADIYCEKRSNGMYAAFAKGNYAYILVDRENDTLKIPFYIPVDTEEKLIETAKQLTEQAERNKKSKAAERE